MVYTCALRWEVPPDPFECRAAIFSRFVMNLFVSVPDKLRRNGNGFQPDARRHAQGSCPCAGRRHPGGRPTSGRFARACCQHDFWMFRPEGLSAASNCRRCAPERKSPAQAARRPLRRSARMDPSDPDEEPRARPRSPRSDGKETCALTMVPGRPPFPCPRFSLPERASRLPRRLASRTGIRPDGRKGGFL